MDTTPSENTSPTSEQRSASYAIPLAIIAGFAMVAAAVYFSNQTAAPDDTTGRTTDTAAPARIAPINGDDHVRGNPNAPIVIIEYSDFDCPFCKQFHATMQQVMNEYGPSGKVAWVYRHFPLEQLHPSAPFIARASECVAKLSDDPEAFWTFADLVFNERGINDLTDTTALPSYAVAAGVDQAAYEACVLSGETQELVTEDTTGALNAGVRGTPYSFILVGGEQLAVNGSQSFAVMKANIDGLLQQLERVEN